MSVIKRSLLQLIGPKLLWEARVADAVSVSQKFRFIELEAEQLKSATWVPGGKVQINTGAWNLRTYTPFSIDNENGRLGILAYVNGKGPGSSWAQNVQPGDKCFLRGPSRSLAFPEIRGPLLFFGDETSVAAATTLKRSLPFGTSAHFVFEASEPREVQKVVMDLGFEHVQVVPKTKDGHLADEASRSFLQTASRIQSGQIILSGRAESIRILRNLIKGASFTNLRVQAKPYWAEGKAGFD
jgi:ferric-chelate reductase (NADPH)